MCVPINFYGQKKGNAEKSIDQYSIYQKMLEVPIPQGIVDENSPWLHFRVPLKKVKKKGDKNELEQRRYHFLLSKDSTFTKGVIRSKPKLWSFFNPYTVLEKGIWYWKYGVSLEPKSRGIKWSSEKYTFKITGSERQVSPPTAREVIKRIVEKPGPHVVLLPDEIGNLLPSEYPEIKEGILNNLKKLLKKRPEIKIVVDESTYPNRLKGNSESKKFRFFQLATLKQFKGFSNRIESLLKGYLLTGNEDYKKRGLEEFYKLDHQFHTIMMKYGKHPGYPDDFVLEAHIKLMTLILDAFAKDISEEWRNKIVELLFKFKKELIIGVLLILAGIIFFI